MEIPLPNPIHPDKAQCIKGHEEMLKILSAFWGTRRTEITDAKRIYRKIMAQSRRSEFFTKFTILDSFDGRMEVLYLHLAVVHCQLRAHGETGQKLAQALYDVMIEDFDIALREESITDTGVKRRIKPLAGMFFSRLKAYTNALADSPKAELGEIIGKFADSGSVKRLNTYIRDFDTELSIRSLGDIALTRFAFPKL